jgi:hypothetical protein
MTGSGKTYLTKVYAAGMNNVIVLDTKGTFDWQPLIPDAPIFYHLKDLMHFKEGKAIYRPVFQELTQAYYNAFFKWCYLRKNTRVIIDEAMQVCPGPNIMPEYLKGILTRGRELKVTVWACTQRPKTIPLSLMSEATHNFIFTLNLEADRRRVNEVINYNEIVDYIPELYHFWYYKTGLDKPQLATLGE